MAHTMSEVRIDLNRCNDLLEELGQEPLQIQSICDGGGRSKRLLFSDNHIASERCTPNEMDKALDLLVNVLWRLV